MAQADSLFFAGSEAPSQRARMLEAITRAVAEKGYARVTVADIVGMAGVSRRTFYEHFEDREACLLAAASEGTAGVFDRVARAGQELPDDASWQQILEAGMVSYVGTLAANPHFARTFLVDIPGTS